MDSLSVSLRANNSSTILKMPEEPSAAQTLQALARSYFSIQKVRQETLLHQEALKALTTSLLKDHLIVTQPNDRDSIINTLWSLVQSKAIESGKPIDEYFSQDVIPVPFSISYSPLNKLEISTFPYPNVTLGQGVFKDVYRMQTFNCSLPFRDQTDRHVPGVLLSMKKQREKILTGFKHQAAFHALKPDSFLDAPIEIDPGRAYQRWANCDLRFVSKYGSIPLTLAQHSEMKKVSRTQIFQALFPVLEGLILMHSKGYVHSDLRTDNVMMCLEGEKLTAKLNDFDNVKQFCFINRESQQGRTFLDSLGNKGYYLPSCDTWAFILMLAEISIPQFNENITENIFNILNFREAYCLWQMETLAKEYRMPIRLMNQLFSSGPPQDINSCFEAYQDCGSKYCRFFANLILAIFAMDLLTRMNEGNDKLIDFLNKNNHRINTILRTGVDMKQLLNEMSVLYPNLSEIQTEMIWLENQLNFHCLINNS